MFDSKILEDSKYITNTFNPSFKKDLKLCTDSRAFVQGMAFLGIKGEKFDGGKFLEQILEKGCPLAVISNETFQLNSVEEIAKKYPESKIVLVSDTIKFLQEISKKRRDEWVSNGGRIIGITGSNGKTTTKEMLFAFADKIYPGCVLKTKGNLNNHLGVPFTLLDLEDSQKIAIVEMGTNHPGEIQFLCELAGPQSGMISSVGVAHIEFFGTVEKILEEKGALYRYVRDHADKESIFLLNALDKNLKTLPSFPGVIRLGEEVTFTIKDDQSVDLFWNDSEISFKNSNIQEDYNIQNLIAAFLLINACIPGHTFDLIEVLKNFKLPKLNRSEWIFDKNKHIFLDAYNANPTSMMAALRSFKNYLVRNKLDIEKSLIVIGDMNELGDQAEQHHHAVANLLNELGLNKAFFVGRYAHYYADEFRGTFSKVFQTTDELKKEWPLHYANNEYFFLKASRSLQLESIIDIR
ncbi:UDP-N-acetylmuramoyl-tripeptide--D-alanyl-D-alanine ligase [Bacteriovorax sp. BSW11_IV]|uniref:UDP-N-acetylmuramoyl-tripeptide--D-alanyl-D- alanine ligase n=1 Tax=Bacteriovorax sp. BSW11_IV TaxID=1353529 RepID=UPI000389F932|nr:UDP-N-acetylmuramoyl-tripeptide--D-alanyl-D-alanine ligase [Bacteriovorax sp. BSW11_IV]EQC42889.1 UDP-N-acetylmuramoyl-tripeptide--D-alanyl-D-alanine ligase [Bacteriovorax sp. BSW11_IV]